MSLLQNKMFKDAIEKTLLKKELKKEPLKRLLEHSVGVTVHTPYSTFYLLKLSDLELERM